ncbi:MAG: radical SAM protein, partial [Deltaproteobacteria bacterium]|nr:radical SAM protein [Deltaproteobacteria bacterium]
PVLPYDPSRGCYWGKCAFCHYGLCSQGTAVYRERKIPDIVDHLTHLSKRWGCGNFYFSQDAFLPETTRELALSIKNSGLDITWSTDMRPEKGLTENTCMELRKGGALSMALGIESASPRLLKLINKGVSVDTMKTAVKNLASAGIAVEVMCFNNFPTETLDEAMATLGFIKTLKKDIALFINGRFGLSHGSRVALFPEKYGIKKIWRIEGDELGTGLFYETQLPGKSADDQDIIDESINSLSKYWWLHDYPWAGSLSTAHTILWYAKRGKDVFRNCAETGRMAKIPKKRHPLKIRYNINRMESLAMDNEADIWDTMMHKHRKVSEYGYNMLAEKLPLFYPEKR